MAHEHILSLLIAERDKLSKAIEALGGATKKPGRPSKSSEAPAVAAATSIAEPKRRKRKPLTASQKKAHSERMKAFWAARRKKSGKG